MHNSGCSRCTRGRARPGAAAPQAGEDHRDRRRRSGDVRQLRARRAGPEVPIPVADAEWTDLLVQLNDRPGQQLRGRLEHGPGGRDHRPAGAPRLALLGPALHQASALPPPSRRHRFGGAQQAAAGVGAARPAGRGEPGEPNRRARWRIPLLLGVHAAWPHRAYRRSPVRRSTAPAMPNLIIEQRIMWVSCGNEDPHESPTSVTAGRSSPGWTRTSNPANNWSPASRTSSRPATQ
jgi:hypothetical protein